MTDPRARDGGVEEAAGSAGAGTGATVAVVDVPSDGTDVLLDAVPSVLEVLEGGDSECLESLSSPSAQEMSTSAPTRKATPAKTTVDGPVRRGRPDPSRRRDTPVDADPSTAATLPVATDHQRGPHPHRMQRSVARQTSRCHTLVVVSVPCPAPPPPPTRPPPTRVSQSIRIGPRPGRRRWQAIAGGHVGSSTSMRCATPTTPGLPSSARTSICSDENDARPTRTRT